MKTRIHTIHYETGPAEYDDRELSVTVEVGSAFPGVAATEATMLAALAELSRDDAIFFCARLNALVSGFSPNRSRLDRQRDALSLLQVPEAVATLNKTLAEGEIQAERTVFFRGQLLELARWILAHCTNHPGEPHTFERESVRMAFLRAALTASEFWRERVYGDRLADEGDPVLQLRRALGPFRKGTEEANEAAHPGAALGRGWLLFAKHMPQRLPDFLDLFRKASGLTLDEYFICAFGLMQKTFAQNANNGIFSTVGYADATAQTDLFNRFIALRSQSIAELANELSNFCRSGYKAIRERPILNFKDNRSVILDAVYYMDAFLASPLFLALKQAGQSRNNEVFSAFGLAFEDYAIDFLEHMYPTGALARRIWPRAEQTVSKGQSFEVDAILNDATSLTVFEIKAAWIREDKILSENPDVFTEHLRSLFGISSDPEKRPRGVAQLASRIQYILEGRWKGEPVDYTCLREVFPVLLVSDDRMGASGIGKFLDQEFRQLLGVPRQEIYVHPLILMTIDDLEMLATSIEGFGLADFLRDYSVSTPERLSSLRTYILSTPKYATKIRPNAHIFDAAREFGRTVVAVLFPKDSSAESK